jgi:hypothetical protein
MAEKSNSVEEKKNHFMKQEDHRQLYFLKFIRK